jgi:hypothetical protein
MAYFASRVARSAQNLSIKNESTSDTGAESDEEQVFQVGPALTDSEVKLRQRSRVAVMLNQNRNPGKFLHQVRLQRHMMPTRQVRGIDQNSLIYFERPAHGDTDRRNDSTRRLCFVDQSVGLLHDSRKRGGEWLRRVCRNLGALHYFGASRAHDTGRLRATNVETQHSAQTGLCSFDQILLRRLA